MSDRITRLLAGYAVGAPGERVPDETRHEVQRRVLDAIGVAVAGRDEAAAVAARAYAASVSDPGGAVVWESADRADPEAAGFANAVAVRCLDFNDTYLSREPLHPSDCIPPLLALAEVLGRSPLELLDAVAVAYQVTVCLCDAASLRAHGWDHVNHLGIGVACGAVRLLGLPLEVAEHAISLTVVPHAAMRQTRAGELSMWKGAARLAATGMTGPFEPFEGEMGFVRQLLGGESFDDAALRPLADLEPPRAILRTYVKRWPVEYHAQSAVDAALRLRNDLGGRVDGIEELAIDTFEAGYEIIAKDPEKWDPTTRETADHSLPYITLAALLDGDVTRRTFEPVRFRDPATLELLRTRVRLREDPELSAGYPDGVPNRITVRTRDGRSLSREVRYPPGHARNPMSDGEVSSKYRSNVAERWKPERAERVEHLVWGLPSLPDVRALTDALAAEP